MVYRIFIERNVEKKFNRIPIKIRKSIASAIAKLKNNPRSLNVRKITSSENYYRIRAGDYRIIYEINDREKRIDILRIRHRKDAYLNL